MKDMKRFFNSWFPLLIYITVTMIVGYALWNKNSELSRADQFFTVLDISSANAFAVLGFLSMLVLAGRKFLRMKNYKHSLNYDDTKKHGGLVVSVGSRGNSKENASKLSRKFNISPQFVVEVNLGEGQGNVERDIVIQAKEKILDAYNLLVENGVDDIFLIIAGPLPIVFLAGDILSNKLPVYFIKHPEFEVWHVTENNHKKQEMEVIEGYEH